MPEPKDLDEAREMLGEFAAIVDSQKHRIETLEAKLDELLSKAGKSSRNSSLPPSSDSSAQRAERPKRKPRSHRRQGAQPGHPKHDRPLVPEGELDGSVPYFPNALCECGGHIVIDADPRCRHQVFNLPPIKASVIEHQLFGGTCSCCQRKHRAEIPASVPSGQMGPGLIAFIATLSGQFHLSTRKIQRLLRELWQLEFSLGAISEAQGRANGALVIPYLGVGRTVRQQDIVNADETRHFRDHRMFWMWVLSSPVAVYFMTHHSRGMNAADQLLGDFEGVLVTDDYAGYNHVPPERRQLCWSHQSRHFIAMSERPGRAGVIGKRLHLIACILFRIRHHFAAGRISEATWNKRTVRMRRHCLEAIKAGTRLRLDTRTQAQCAHLLKREVMLWTFLGDPRIPLENNRAERDIRPYVLWRKISHAVQSHRGNQFRPMILTIVTTAERLGISAYDYLRQICTEYAETGRVTTLLETRAPCLPAPT